MGWDGPQPACLEGLWQQSTAPGSGGSLSSNPPSPEPLSVASSPSLPVLISALKKKTSFTPESVSDNWLKSDWGGWGLHFNREQSLNKRVVLNTGHKGSDRSSVRAFGSFWSPLHLTYYNFVTVWLKMSSRSSPTHQKDENNYSSRWIADASQTPCNTMEGKHKAILPGSICVKETRPSIWRARMIDTQ